MNRKHTVFNHLGEVVQDTYEKDVEWEEVRAERDKLLKKTDLWYLKDRWDALSTTAKGQINSYRAALRDLPQTYPDSPNDAADNFPVPEEWFA